MPKVEAGADLEDELHAAASEFDAVCEATSKERPLSIHKMLDNAESSGEGRRLLMRELKQRRERESSS